MGADIRVPFPEERPKRAARKAAKVLAWVALAGLLVVSALVLPRWLGEGHVATNAADQGAVPVPRREERAQPIVQPQAPGGKITVGPKGTTAEVRSPGPVLPPGTTTLPPVPPGSSNLVGTGVSGLATTVPRTGSSAKTLTDPRLNAVWALIEAPDPDAHVGATIAVDGAVVQLETDRAFAIGPSAQKYLYVLFPQTTPPVSPARWKPFVRPGQRVYIEGTIQRVPSLSQGIAMFGLKGDVRQALGPSELYIQARILEPFPRR